VGQSARSTVRATADDFAHRTGSLLGLRVSRPWKGYGSALFLEFGQLRPSYVGRKRRKPLGPKGEATLMIDWTWRAERLRSIPFGSESSPRKITSGIAGFKGPRVEGIALLGRLPEIVVRLSGNAWVQSFGIAETQPQWVLFLQDGSYFHVLNGYLVRSWCVANRQPNPRLQRAVLPRGR
jgi:hypothetical protein